MTVTVVKDDTAKLFKAISKMGKDHVLIGIPEDKSTRRGDAETNAQIGYINEFGSGIKNIPARPFLRPGVKDAEEKCIKVMADSVKDIMRRSTGNALDKCGLIAQAAVKRRIVSQEGFAPLSVSTLAARKKKGFEGEKALIRTGQLLNSITYVVRPR